MNSRESRRPWQGKWDMPGSLILAAGLMALVPGGSAWAQSAATMNTDFEHEYIHSGRVEAGGIIVAGIENRLQAKNGVGAFVTRDTVYMQDLSLQCILIICGDECRARPIRTLALPLPGPREESPPPMALLRAVRGQGGSFQATVVVARGGNVLHRMDIEVAGGAVKDVKRTSISMQELEGKSARVFGDLEEISDTLPRGFLVLGTGGLLRQIEEASDGTMKETRLSSGVKSNFISYGNGLAGTDSGAIYRVWDPGNYYPLVYQGQPVQQPIVRIDAYAALYADGTYRVNRAETWQGPFGDTGTVTGVHPEFTLKGTTLRVSRTEQTADRFIGDSPTYMVWKSNTGRERLFIQEDIEYDGRSRAAFDLLLRDPDRNATPPRIESICGGDDIVYLLSQELVQADPKIGCVATGMCLTGAQTAVTVTLHADSLYVSFPVLAGTVGMDQVCKRPTFTGKASVFRIARRWYRGSRLFLRLGEKTLTFKYGESTAIKSGGARELAGKGARFGIGDGYLLPGPNGFRYNASGRQMAVLP